jgi:tetratricopeptide (TPR) repeat protein
MNEQANILFNMSFSFSGNKAGKVELFLPDAYLQRSIHAALARSLYTREGFELLGRQLAAIARHAYFARQMDTVEQASQLMLALPLSKEQTTMAQYYQAICTWKQMQHQDVEQIIEAASPNYQAQGLFSIGTIHHRQGQLEAALSHYLAAAHTAREHDLLTFAASQKMVAVIRSIYGDHHQALNDLEHLFPLVRAIARHCPVFYHDFLNSYAVELGEVGRINEAQMSVLLHSRRHLRRPILNSHRPATSLRQSARPQPLRSSPCLRLRPKSSPPCRNCMSHGGGLRPSGGRQSLSLSGNSNRRAATGATGASWGRWPRRQKRAKKR